MIQRPKARGKDTDPCSAISPTDSSVSTALWNGYEVCRPSATRPGSSGSVVRRLRKTYSLSCVVGDAGRSAGIGPEPGGARQGQDLVAEVIQRRLDGAGDLVQRTLPSTRMGKP